MNGSWVAALSITFHTSLKQTSESIQQLIKWFIKPSCLKYMSHWHCYVNGRVSLLLLTFRTPMDLRATVNMWWRICPLFSVLIIHHPVWHCAPVLCVWILSYIYHEAGMLTVSRSQLRWRRNKLSMIFAQIGQILQHGVTLKTTSKNSSCCCHFAIMKQMRLYICVCVCVRSFRADCRLILQDPHSSSSHVFELFLLACVDASASQWKCLSVIAWV